MATIIGSGEVLGGGYIRHRWESLGNGDDGAAATSGMFADRSIQVTGTFGSGGEVVIEGSNDGGSNYETLTDAFGGTLSITSASLLTVMQFVQLIRPRVIAGDGTTDLNVYLVGSKPV